MLPVLEKVEVVRLGLEGERWMVLVVVLELVVLLRLVAGMGERALMLLLLLVVVLEPSQVIWTLEEV